MALVELLKEAGEDKCQLKFQVRCRIIQSLFPGCPDGVVNVIHGQHETVNFICDHPDIRAVSFVGGDAAGKHIYERGSSNGGFWERRDHPDMSREESAMQHGSEEPRCDHA